MLKYNLIYNKNLVKLCDQIKFIYLKSLINKKTSFKAGNNTTQQTLHNNNSLENLIYYF